MAIALRIELKDRFRSVARDSGREFDKPESESEGAVRLDLRLENAHVRTMDPTRPRARSVGVANGRIVGVDEEIEGLPADSVVDVNAATIVPGFNDAHAHSVWFGLSLAEIDLGTASSLEDVYLRIAGAAATSDEEWIIAGGYNHLAHGGRFPDRDLLDAAAGQRPVWIKHNSGHASIVNGAGLARIGSDRRAPQVVGGRVVVDTSGRPTGVLEENAMRLVQSHVLPYAPTSIEDALERATRRYAAEGITSVTDAGIAGGWIGHSPVEFGAYQNARDAGRLHARMQAMIAIDALGSEVPLGLGAGVRSGIGDEWLQIGPAKIFTDGSLLASTAYMTENYPGFDHHGYLQGDPETLRSHAISAAQAGWALALHAIGDGAVDFALDVLQTVSTFGVRTAMPHRIEHAAVTRPDQVARLLKSGAIAVPQPHFITMFGDGMRDRLGERTSWAYRAASLVAGGMPLPGSSDRPVAPGPPLTVIQAFVERTTESGQPFGTAERLTPAQALHAYTVGSAIATGWSQHKGRIRQGMLADMAILADDPLTIEPSRISEVDVLATLLGGSFTFGGTECFE